MSNYTWIVTGGTITAGGTINDNTVTVTWTGAAGTVSVNYNNATNCTAAAPAVNNVTINPLPVPTITGNAAACLNSTGNIYTTEAGMSNYTWIVTGGTITAGGTINDNTVTVTWTGAAGTVSVNYNNATNCTAAAPAVNNVTINPLPVPTITGNAAACLNSTGNIYTTEAGMSNYTWIVTGGTITAGGTINDNTVTVTWTGAAGTVSVNYNNATNCTAAAPAVNNVTINPLPVPTITGNAAACLNSTGNIYTTEAGMSNYTWIVTGGTITAGGTINDNTVTVTWTGAAGTVSVNYNNATNCTAAAPAVNNVTINPLPVPTITGNAAACLNSTGNIYTTEAGMSNYTWIVTGGTITAGGTINDNTVTVTWTGAAGTVSVNYNNATNCTAAAPAVNNVTINPLPVPTITGNAAACLNSTGNIYTTEAGMSNYTWIVTGGTITAGGTINDNTVTVTWTGAAGTVSVNYNNATNCTAAAPAVNNVTINPLPVPTITGNAAACLNSTGNIYTTEAGMSNYTWIVTGGTITAGGTINDNTVTVTWTGAAGTVSVNYNNATNCTAAAPAVNNVTINP